LKEILPEVDLEMPTPLILRQARSALAESTVPGHIDVINKLSSLARSEKAPGNKYMTTRLVNDITERTPGVTPLEPKFEATGMLNKLFSVRPDDSPVLSRKMYAQGSDASTFPTFEAWKAQAQKAGLPENFDELTQYARDISFNTTKDAELATKRQAKLGGQLQALNERAAKGKITPEEFQKKSSELIKAAQYSPHVATRLAATIERKLTSHLTPVGDGWYIGKESGEGLFVMARKYEGTPGVPSVADRWSIFKTDRPGAFAKNSDDFAKAQIDRLSWLPNSQVEPSGIVGDTLAGFQKTFPFQSYGQIAPSKLAQAVDKLLPKNIRGNEFAGRLQDGVKEFLAPAMHQFKSSPLGNYINNAARVAYENALNTAQELVYGKVGIAKDRNLFYGALRQESEPFKGMKPIKDILDELSDEEIAGLTPLWRTQTTAEQANLLANSGAITRKQADAIAALEKIDQFTLENIRAAQRAAGEPEIKALKGHWGLNRIWEGDTRIALRDDAGVVRGLAAGATRAQALKAAKDMAAEKGWRIGEEFDISKVNVLDPTLKPLIRNPSFLLERQGIDGYKWSRDNFNRKDLLDAYSRATNARYKYQANLAVNNQLGGKLEKLAIADPTMHRILQARLNDLAGVQSIAGKWQNQQVDKLLAPMLGNNSATKIVSITNTVLHTMQLGAMKLAYPIVNLLTAIQTTMPEIAFLLSAPPERLAGAYSFLPMQGRKGTTGILSALDPIKIMTRGMKEMGKPGPELRMGFTRAANERVLDARLVEEYMDQTGTKITDLRRAFSSPGGFGSWVLALSDYLPAQAEKLSRAHTFTTFWTMGRDFMGMEGEALYQFAKKGTERSMYLYSAADRPRIFTTPAGSAFGVFKNWMMHYMASMVEYSGEALRGNWSPLLWQTAGTFGLGGLAATPLIGIADAFTEGFADKSILQWSYDNFGEGADAMVYGLPAYLTGVSLSSNVSSPAANPVRDASFLFSFAALERAKYIRQAAGAAFDSYNATGDNPVKDPLVRDALIRAFMPTTIYRSIAAMEDQQIKSLNSGLPITKDAGMVERVLYAFGFNPLQLEKTYAVASEAQASNDSRKAAVTKNGQLLADAMLNGDGEKASSILRLAAVQGLDISSVMRSARARMAGLNESMTDRKISKKDMVKFENVLGTAD
jgi:hypothetical protein